MMVARTVWVVSLLIGLAGSSALAQTREEKVRADKKRVEAEGFWLYNDIPEAFRQAKETGKPILVNLRCLPCEECVKLDDELVDQDPEIRPLLEQYICVRVVGTNGLDLNLFQYDTDQSFAVFLLNADKQIYGRFGTRSHRTEWFGDVSLKGMAAALRKALELHKQYPNNRNVLADKKGTPALFARPELIPAHRERYTGRLNYEGDVVKSCIHCHQIGDAERAYYRTSGQPIPERLINPYPHPKSLGLIMDPDTCGTVKEVKADSIAEQAEIRKGDELVALDGQPILSMADIQWVLHNAAADGDTVRVDLNRHGREFSTDLQLPAGWRDLDDISWRVGSWPMRRMTTGGMKLAPLDDEGRRAARLADDQMGLRVQHVGRYGPHRAAMNAGVRKDDILISYDGRTDLMDESALLRYGLRNLPIGKRVELVVLRNGQRKTMAIPMQE